MSVVYFIQAGARGPIKVGYATDLGRRVSALQTSSPELLTVLATIEGKRDVERLFHEHLSVHRLRGEWFKPDPIVLEAVEMARRGETPAPILAKDRQRFLWLATLVLVAKAQSRCPDWSPAKLAAVTGLPSEALAGMDREDWNPSLTTLLAIEQFITLPIEEMRELAKGIAA